MSYDPDLVNYAQGVAQQYGIDPSIFVAQIGQESGFNPNARNGKAVGIGQFMPGTAAQFGIDPTDPYASLRAAAQYDSQLLAKNGGDYIGMLQSYGTLGKTVGSSTGPGGSIFEKFKSIISAAAFNMTAGELGVPPEVVGLSTTNVGGAAQDLIVQYGARAGSILAGLVLFSGGVFMIARSSQ